MFCFFVLQSRTLLRICHHCFQMEVYRHITKLRNCDNTFLPEAITVSDFDSFADDQFALISTWRDSHRIFLGRRLFYSNDECKPIFLHALYRLKDAAVKLIRCNHSVSSLYINPHTHYHWIPPLPKRHRYHGEFIWLGTGCKVIKRL